MSASTSSPARPEIALDAVSVRLARSPAEIAAAQRLRYDVFFAELGATPDDAARAAQRDVEAMDDVADHLIVIDPQRASANLGVVGTYRLLRGDALPASRAFYSAGEFDIQRLVHSRARLLELGRSCVLHDYRQRQVLQRLWGALAEYVSRHRIELMFGCASFHGTDPARIESELSYLHHYHLARPALQPRATGSGAIACDRVAKESIEVARVRRRLPPLVRGYLQLGASIGLGAYVDAAFNAIDVCVVLPTADLAARYVRHYERDSAVRLRPASIAQDA